MTISVDTVTTAIAALSKAEQKRMFSSTSDSDGRTSVTKFAAKLAMITAAQLRTADVTPTVRCTFKGNKGGRGAKEAGGLTELRSFANAAADAAGVGYDQAESLLDIIAFNKDIFHVLFTVESEARPSAEPMDVVDLDKLLLVRSPFRIYVGRVNVTKTGNDAKLVSAKETLKARFQAAKNLNHVAEGDTFNIILLQTTARETRSCHLAAWNAATTDFMFTHTTIEQ